MDPISKARGSVFTGLCTFSRIIKLFNEETGSLQGQHSSHSEIQVGTEGNPEAKPQVNPTPLSLLTAVLSRSRDPRSGCGPVIAQLSPPPPGSAAFPRTQPLQASCQAQQRFSLQASSWGYFSREDISKQA